MLHLHYNATPTLQWYTYTNAAHSFEHYTNPSLYIQDVQVHSL